MIELIQTFTSEDLLSLPTDPPDDLHALAPWLGVARAIAGGATPSEIAWALLDGVSCAMSVGVVLPVEPPMSDDQLSARLSLLVERFLAHEAILRPKLLRRPALQMVLYPAAEISDDVWTGVERSVERAARELERRVGLQLPDFRVVAHRERIAPPADPDALPSPAKEMHLRFLDDSEEVSQPVLTELIDRLDKHYEDLKKLKAMISAVHPQEGDWLSPLAALIDATRELPLVALNAEASLRRKHDARSRRVPAAIPLRVRVAARNWSSSEPAILPLASTTLVVADNAAGKTTLLEALTTLTAGVPRARASLPMNSERFHPSHRSGKELPGKGWIDLDFASSEQTADWRNANLIPLFSDDADLAMNDAGDLSIASLWPIANVQWLVATLPQVSRLYGELSSSLQDIAQSLSDPIQDREPPLENVSWKRHSLCLAALDAAAAERRREVAEEQKQQNAEQKDAGTKQQEGENSPTLAPSPWDPYLSWSKDHPRKKSWREAKIPGHLLTEIAKDWGSQAEEMFQAWRGWKWLDVVGPLRTLGRDSLVRELCSGAVRRLQQQLIGMRGNFDAELRSLVTAINALDDGRIRGLVDSLDNYLSHLVTVDRTPRRNTAAVVRLAFAERLARALALSAVTSPMIAIDEPTLGQHATSSARSLARIVRLRRAEEGRRWRDLIPDPLTDPSSSGPAPVLSPRELSVHRVRAEANNDGHLERVPPVQPLPCRARTPAQWPAPSTPLLVLSYQSASLNAVASMEGQQLDHQLQQLLQSLIPDSWRPTLRAKLLELVARWKGQEQRLPGAPPWLARELLLQEPDSIGSLTLEVRDVSKEEKGVSMPSGWFERVLKSLTNLGLRGLWVPYPNAKLEMTQLATLSSMARRLVSWLALTDLLPAALDDGQLAFAVSSVDLRRLTYSGGEAQREGPLRLRRVTPAMLRLPPDPSPPVPKPRDEAPTTPPDSAASPTPLESASASSPDSTAPPASTPAAPDTTATDTAAATPDPKPQDEAPLPPCDGAPSPSQPEPACTSPPDSATQPASTPAAPDISLPDTTAPDTTAPDTAALDTTAPDTTAPDISATDTAATALSAASSDPGSQVSTAPPSPSPAPLTLSLYWSQPPPGARESLVEAMTRIGVSVDLLQASSDDALVITTSERFGEFTHTVAAFLGPGFTMSGETPSIERLIARALHAAIRARWGEDPPHRLEIGFHCGPYPWNRGDTHLRFTAPETDEAAVQERFGRDLDILYRVLQDIRPERIVLNLAVPPGVALRIGWVFREITQMPVTFTGGPPFPDPFESADPNASTDKLSLDHKGDGSESNLDLVVLPTPNGQLSLYQNWRQANTAPTLAFIHDAKLNIPTGDILAWARALHAKILQNRQGPTGPRTIRLFMSGPISLTYALGRLLNAIDLRIMDRAPPLGDQPERYVERFTLRR